MRRATPDRGHQLSWWLCDERNPDRPIPILEVDGIALRAALNTGRHVWRAFSGYATMCKKMKQHSSVTKEDQAEAQSLCAKAGKALFGRKDESAALALLDSHQEIRNKPVDWLRTPKSAESFDSNFSLSGSEIGAYPASNEKTCGKQALLSSYLIAMEGA